MYMVFMGEGVNSRRAESLRVGTHVIFTTLKLGKYRYLVRKADLIFVRARSSSTARTTSLLVPSPSYSTVH